MKDSDKKKSQLIQELSELRQRISAQEKSQTIREPLGLDLKILDYALASSINGIGITDLEGKLIYVNDSTVKMWGFDSKEEILGRHLIEFWEGDSIRRTIQALQQTGGIFGEDIGKRKDGSLFEVQFSASIIKDEKGNPMYMFGSFIDITEHKKIEKKLHKAHDALEKRVEERTAELMNANIQMEQEIKDRKQAEAALKESELKLREQKLALEQKNIALGEIVAQIEIEKIKIKDDIATNITTVLLPFIEKYKTNEAAKKYGDFLRHHLSELTSSFGAKITERRIDLTPREVEICSMVKGGFSNKDISNLMNISSQTVEGHRKNIRRKLGIINKKINLTSFLREL